MRVILTKIITFGVKCFVRYSRHVHYLHCVKNVQILIYFWSVFSCIRTEYGDLRSKSPYSVRIQENTDQKELRIWTLFTLFGMFAIGRSHCTLYFYNEKKPIYQDSMLYWKINFYLDMLLLAPFRADCWFDCLVFRMDLPYYLEIVELWNSWNN